MTLSGSALCCQRPINSNGHA